jgi:hypothetical protein
MTATGEGTLKLVVLAGGDRDGVDRAVRDAGDAVSLGPRAWVVFAAAEPGELRDTIVGGQPGAQIMVVEFERWSSHGDAIDAAWLLRRGH